jgi:hypothetical protein
MQLNNDNIQTMDINILLSLVNLKLRDEFENLTALCRYFDIDAARLETRLSSAGFQYDTGVKQFKSY